MNTQSTTAEAGRRALAVAARIVVKVGSSSLTTTDGGIDDARLDALTEALAARRQGGAGVFRGDRGRAGSTGPGPAAEGSGDPASRGECRPGTADGPVHRGFRAPRADRRAGPADRR